MTNARVAKRKPTVLLHILSEVHIRRVFGGQFPSLFIVPVMIAMCVLLNQPETLPVKGRSYVIAEYSTS